MIKCDCGDRMPSRKYYRDTQFYTVKTRNGRESRPFLGLDCGEHEVLFHTKTKTRLCLVRTWLSMYGDAWIIVKDIKDSEVES